MKQGHYKATVDPLDLIREFDLNFNEGNVIKYVARARRKGGAEDLYKALFYLIYEITKNKELAHKISQEISVQDVITAEIKKDLERLTPKQKSDHPIYGEKAYDLDKNA